MISNVILVVTIAITINHFVLSEIVKDILKNCQFMSCQRDYVIIKQGDMGDWSVDNYFFLTMIYPTMHVSLSRCF